LLRLGKAMKAGSSPRKFMQQDGYDVTAFNLVTLARPDGEISDAHQRKFHRPHDAARSRTLYGDRVLEMLLARARNV
jgi:hypothetical protein